MTSELVSGVSNRAYPQQDTPNGSVVPIFTAARVVTAAVAPTVFAPPVADEGATFAVLDVSSNAATNNITLNGNGKLIDGALTAVLAMNGVSAVFVLDAGQWRRIAPYRNFFEDQPVPTLREDDVTSMVDVHTINGLTLTGKLIENAAISPPALGAGPTNNYNPVGLSTARVIRQNMSAAGTLTGLNAQELGRRVCLLNNAPIAARTLTLTHQDVGSLGVNRFDLPGFVALVIRPSGSVELWYDTLGTRWRVWGTQ